MGTLFLDDGAGIGCASWVLRAIVADVARVLPRFGASELAGWLTGETSPAELYGHLDVRELTADNQKAFRAAIGPAFLESKARGPIGWAQPSYWEGYIRLFGSLAEQSALLERGEIPAELPNLSGVSPYDGTRNGPGWGR